MNGTSIRLQIERLGQHGEGVARGPVFVPYALPGDTIVADVDGERGRLAAVLQPGVNRTAPFCPYFTKCGGCAVQGFAATAYAEWKRAIVVSALAHAGVEAAVAPLRDAHGDGRRRATFHARTRRYGLQVETEVGFMQARAHAIVAIDACPILAPDMANALAAARAVARALATPDRLVDKAWSNDRDRPHEKPHEKPRDKPLDIDVTATAAGIDVNLRGCGPLSFDMTQDLVAAAQWLDLARIGNHGRSLVERRAPQVVMGRAAVTPPPGAFLQATLAGEAALADLVCGAVVGSRQIADLFAGVGTFALRLLETGDVHAVENGRDAHAALMGARWPGPRPHGLTGEIRDLMRRPLTRAELARFDAVVFDPPRAGAQAQAVELAGSDVATVVAVSCHAATFARDAKILIDGGLRCEAVTPVDQFRHSSHVEIVGVFRRPPIRGRRPRRLLG